MFKKMNLVAKAISVALMAMLFFSSALFAFATTGAPLQGTEANPAKVVIGKLFKMPDGTTTPSATFTFDISKVSIDDKTTQADLATMPDVTPKNVSFTDKDKFPVPANGVKLVYKQTASVFDGIAWPHAGVYAYKVVERDKTYNIADPTKEDLTYSKAEYELTAYVQDGANGLYVHAIAAKILVKDDSSTGTTGDKINPQPGDPTIDGSYSDLIFTNLYLKKTGGSNPVTDTVLTIHHEVANPYADQTKYFEYSVVVNKPAAMANVQLTYKAFVMDANNTVVTSQDNAASNNIKPDKYGSYIEFTPGTPLKVNLKHGQWLSFVDLHVGSTYTATASAVADYKHSFIITEKDVKGPVQMAPGPNQAWGLTTERMITEGTDRADFTASYKIVTPTGISVDNLPYIVLIAVALAGLAGYAAAKSRRRREAAGQNA